HRTRTPSAAGSERAAHQGGAAPPAIPGSKARQVPMIDWFELNLIALINVIVIDVVLAGDNAIIVGLAASRVAPEVRKRVIFWGMAGAGILSIPFSPAAPPPRCLLLS